MSCEPFIDTVTYRGKIISMKSQALNLRVNYSQSKVPNPGIKDLLIPSAMIFPQYFKTPLCKEVNLISDYFILLVTVLFLTLK